MEEQQTAQHFSNGDNTPKEPNGPNADRLKQLIPQTKDKLASQQKTDTPGANTPNNKTP